ncbi:hypothetical protein JCM18237_27810 [Halorubrum luteum]
MQRREYVAAAGVVLSGSVTGCLVNEETSDTEELEGYVQPAEDPSVTPEPFDCPEGWQRVEQQFSESELAWGEYPQDDPVYALRVSDTAVRYGETVTVTHTLVADDPTPTQSPMNYNLQLHTEEGWTEIRGWKGEQIPYPASEEEKSPGWQYERELEMSTAGIDDDTGSLDGMSTCDDLLTGRYRLVWWAVDEADAGVGVAFDLIE